jgi:hypothetical protein
MLWLLATSTLVLLATEPTASLRRLRSPERYLVQSITSTDKRNFEVIKVYNLSGKPHCRIMFSGDRDSNLERWRCNRWIPRSVPKSSPFFNW